jgi:hypothetical protein
MYFAPLNKQMMKSLFFLSFSVFSLLSIAQQPLKTRQSDWQQRVNYTIQVRLNDADHTLSATEKISYMNNSPSELREIYMHLWPNAYKNNETAFARQKLENGKTDFYFSTEADKGWIDSLDFKVNGQRVTWYLLDSIDICKIELPKPLKSGEQIEITTPFKVKLPRVFSRMGHEGQTYCITQWYPKPAVYDVNGWNYIPYLDQGEFYSEFGKFDVSITVPKNYVVAATGELQNDEERIWLMDRSSEKFKAAGNVVKEAVPPSSNEYKTLRFVQDNVHDFAWFCDKQFKVERSEVLLKSGRKVTTWLYDAAPRHSAVHWVDTAVSFYSRMLGEYPYANASAVVTPLKAGGGMEYPTITNIESPSREVIVHEVGHNWFYGILANNERIYPWMDESFNTYYENRSASEGRPVAFHKGIRAAFTRNGKERSQAITIGETPFGLVQLEYYLSARNNSDQPVTIPAYQFTDQNYGSIIYAKAPLLFNYLQNYLGDSLFDSMMQSYYREWKFRHPLPDDFFSHARNITGKNLDWFCNTLMNTTEKQDYKIVSVAEDKIGIKNKSATALPFSVSLMKHDSVLSTTWFEGVKGKTNVLINGIKDADKIRVDAYESTVDLYRDNNTIRTRGLFRSVETITFRWLGDLENPYQTQIFYTPVAGANLYNKTMLGAAFYNGLLPKRKFDYVLVPLYSFGTRDIVGYGTIERHFAATGLFRSVHLGVSGARFGYGGYGNDMTYNKIAPFVTFDLNKHNKRSNVNQQIQLRSVLIINSKNTDTKEAPYQIAGNSRIDEIVYRVNNKRAINANSLNVSAQHIDNQSQAVKLSVEAKQTVNYNKPKKKLTIRLFAGSFLYTQSSAPGIGEYAFRTTGNNGSVDYMFDQALFGRSAYDGLFAHQVIEREGYLKMPDPSYTSMNWLTSGNFVSTIPGPLPLRLFADIAFIQASDNTNSGTVQFQYITGVKLVLAEDILEVNFPLYYSSAFDTQLGYLYPGYSDENKFKQLSHRITFTLNLNRLNPIKGIREASFF